MSYFSTDGIDEARCIFLYFLSLIPSARVAWEVLHVGGTTFEPYQTWSFERSEKPLFDEGE